MEGYDEVIVNRNLRLMRSSEEGGMRLLLGRESLGGSAVVIEGKNYPLAVANFFYNEDGRIGHFGNWEYVPEDIKRGCRHGTFLAAADLSEDAFFRIVETGLEGHLLGAIFQISEYCKANIAESVRRYNLLDSLRAA